jgi:hypothetical protein
MPHRHPNTSNKPMALYLHFSLSSSHNNPTTNTETLIPPSPTSLPLQHHPPPHNNTTPHSLEPPSLVMRSARVFTLCGSADPRDRTNTPWSITDRHLLRQPSLTQTPARNARFVHTSFKGRSCLSLIHSRWKGGSPMHGRWESSLPYQNPRATDRVWMTTAKLLWDRLWGYFLQLSSCDF